MNMFNNVLGLSISTATFMLSLQQQTNTIYPYGGSDIVNCYVFELLTRAVDVWDHVRPCHYHHRRQSFQLLLRSTFSTYISQYNVFSIKLTILKRIKYFIYFFLFFFYHSITMWTWGEFFIFGFPFLVQ